MSRPPGAVRPLGPAEMLVGLLLLVGGLVALLGGLAQLAPPPPGPPLAVLDVDPRDARACDEPPLEGEERRPTVGFGAPLVDASTLLACPQEWHGRRVSFQGEVVGGLLEREGGVWTQLNDDVDVRAGTRRAAAGAQGVGVLLPWELAQAVDAVGGPTGSGDRLEVVGRFQRVDPGSGEVAVLRVEAGRVVTQGQRFEAAPPRALRTLALVLAPLAVVAVLVERIASRGR